MEVSKPFIGQGKSEDGGSRSWPASSLAIVRGDQTAVCNQRHGSRQMGF